MRDYRFELEKYAALAVNVGINVQENEGLIISANEFGLPLAREVMKKAYEAGAKHVEFMMSDDEMTLARYFNAKESVFDHFPLWKADSHQAIIR